MYFSFTINYPVPNLKFVVSLLASIAPPITPENTHHAAVEYYHPDFDSQPLGADHRHGLSMKLPLE